MVKAVEELKHSPVRRLREEEWSEEQGLILFRGKVYVPKQEEIRRKIVELHHDSAVAGHPGKWKTLELMSRNYWWPGMTKFVTQYIEGCDKCNRTKTFPAPPVGKLMPNRTPSAPWTDISVDMITGLPDSQGNDAILVVVDRFSKMTHIIPCSEELSSLGLAALYRDHVWRYHGLPDSVISDRGPQFASQLMKDLHSLLGVKRKLSTAYHPQSDGQTERTNQEIEQYLRLFINHRQNDWADWLAIAEFALNNRVSSSTQVSPFYANTGRHPRMGVEPRRNIKSEAAEDFALRMKKVHEEVEAALNKAADEMKRFADQGRIETPEYKVGDKVYLDLSDIKTDRPSKKLSHKRDGPFEITKVVSPNAYKLKLPKRYNKLHPVFNVSKLRRYTPPQIEGQRSKPPPPIQVEGEPQYEVEEILNSKLERGKLYYLIKWKGYTDEHNTWEPEDNVDRAKRLVRQFHQLHPNAPRRINAALFTQLPFRPLETYTDATISVLEKERTKHIPTWSIPPNRSLIGDDST